MASGGSLNQAIHPSSSTQQAHLREKLSDAEARVSKADEEIRLLEGQIRTVEVLYKRAIETKKHPIRYNQRLKVLQGESFE